MKTYKKRKKLQGRSLKRITYKKEKTPRSKFELKYLQKNKNPRSKLKSKLYKKKKNPSPKLNWKYLQKKNPTYKKEIQSPNLKRSDLQKRKRKSNSEAETKRS